MKPRRHVTGDEANPTPADHERAEPGTSAAAEAAGQQDRRSDAADPDSGEPLEPPGAGLGLWGELLGLDEDDNRQETGSAPAGGIGDVERLGEDRGGDAEARGGE